MTRTATTDQTLSFAVAVEELSYKTRGNPQGWVDLPELHDTFPYTVEVLEQAHRDGLVAVNYTAGVVRPA